MSSSFKVLIVNCQKRINDLPSILFEIFLISLNSTSFNEKLVVIDEDLIMFKSPTIYSKPIVILEKGKLSKIIKCKNEWCKAKSGKYKGWLKRESLWGLL